MSDGINYLDNDGHWQISKDLVEIQEHGTGGAAAVQGPMKIFFPPALGPGEDGFIRMITPSNHVFRIRPIALYLVDAESGKSLLLGSLRESEGELVGENQVVYRGVFEGGLNCDIRYTYRRGSFESDLVILERPARSPGDADSELSGVYSRLELWHEVITDQEPVRTPRILRQETNIAQRARMVEPDLIDETIDFQDFRFSEGYGFSSGDEPRQRDGKEVERGLIPIAKRWGRLGGQDGKGGIPGISESIPWVEIKAKLESLPVAREAANRSGPVRQARLEREVPTFQAATTKAPGRTMKLADAGYRPNGFIMDYTTVYGSGGYYAFTAATFFISGPADFGLEVDFHGGAVLKYANDAYLRLMGPVTCYSSSANPAILSSMHDDSVGQQIAGSVGRAEYSAAKALRVYAPTTGRTLTGLSIRWAKIGIMVEGNACGAVLSTLVDSSIQQCQTGVNSIDGYLYFQNCTKCNLGTAIAPGSCYSGSLTESCPATLGEAVDQPGWAFSTGGNANCYYQTATTYSGGDAVQSGLITHNQSSYFQTTIAGPGTVNFYWKVSSEYNYDFLRVYVDGAQQAAISGEVGWTPASVTICDGSHTVQWAYTKDGSVNAGSDAGWVDLVQFTPGGCPPSITSQPASQTVSAGVNVTFNVGATGSGTLSYQWRFNGSPLTGPTGSSFTTNNVQTSSAGAYFVFVSSAYGSVTSADAVLTVTAASPPSGCTPPPSGIVAWWRAEGNANDATNANHGALVNGAIFGGAKVVQGFSFDGADDYVEVPSSTSLNPTSGLTLEAWVYQTGNSGQNQALISKDGIWANRQYFLTLYINKFRAHIGTTVSGLVYFDGATQPALNTWYHVAMTYDGSYLRLYVNGQLDGSASASGNIITSSQVLKIGGETAGGWGNYKFAGKIDEVSVYNRALSQIELQAIHGAGSAGKCIDTDSDGMPDAWELQYFGTTARNGTGDYDSDSLSDLQEFQRGTQPTVADSDGDGVSDGTEVIQGRNPLIAGTVPDTGQINLQVFTPLK